MHSVLCTLNTVWNLHLCTFASLLKYARIFDIFMFIFFLTPTICLKRFSSWVVDHNWISNSLPPEWEKCLLSFVCAPVTCYWFCPLTKKAQPLESNFSFCEYSVTSDVLIRPLERYFINKAWKCMNVKVVEIITRWHETNCSAHIGLYLLKISAHILMVVCSLQYWCPNTFQKTLLINFSRYLPSFSQPFWSMNNMQTNPHTLVFSKKISFGVFYLPVTTNCRGRKPLWRWVSKNLFHTHPTSPLCSLSWKAWEKLLTSSHRWAHRLA